MVTADVEIKICGLTNRDDAAAALGAGADYLGFVLYAESPRGIRATQLRRILDKAGEIRNAVGVFVNRPRAEVLKIAEDCGLCAVQIHGDEAAEEFKDMPLPVWRALRLKGGECIPEPSAWPAERYVADASAPGLYGGTGLKTDWTAAAALARSRKVMLAGGLTPENVADAVRTVRPAGVDVAGGVEQLPGRKDRRKIEAFIRAARSA